MKDQVDALQSRGIPAVCLDSTKTYDEQMSVNALIRKGNCRLLYCAPERVNNERFAETMRFVPGGVRLIAVDEAHCISEWGHSFRPDYLKVARFAREVKAERVICLTATATPRVAEDIRNAFSIKECNSSSPGIIYFPFIRFQASFLLHIYSRHCLNSHSLRQLLTLASKQCFAPRRTDPTYSCMQKQ